MATPNPWENVSVSVAHTMIPRGYAHADALVASAGNPTPDEVVAAMRAAEVGKYGDPMRDTLRRTVGDAFSTVGFHTRAVLSGMTALVEAILGERIDFRPTRWDEPLVDVFRRDLGHWVADRRADAEYDGEPSSWDLDAAAALVDRPPVLMVAATVNHIADRVRSAAFDAIGELGEGDGRDLGDAAKRASADAWRHAAKVWVASRA